MDEKDPAQAPDSKVRKTVTFTQKQFGYGGGIVAALLAIQPLQNMFMTNDKAEVMRVQIQKLDETQAEIKASLASTKADISKIITDGNHLIIQSIRDAEGRTVNTDRRHERLIERLQSRVDSYEAALFNRSSRKQN